MRPVLPVDGTPIELTSTFSVDPGAFGYATRGGSKTVVH